MRNIWVFAWMIALAGNMPAQGEPAGSNLPAQPIGATDLLAISVYGAPELTRTVRVSDDGLIRLPMLRRKIDALGLMPAQLETLLADALAEEEILVDPAVTVTIAEYHSRPISVAGAVRSPLTFQAVGKTTLLEALTRAQGLTEDAGLEILLTRPAKSGGAALVERIPVKKLLDESDPLWNVTLQGGEEVRVPQGGRVFVVGNVKHPGAYRVDGGGETTVLKAVALAEGLAPFATKDAYIFRPGTGGVSETGMSAGTRSEIPVELRKIMDRKSPDVELAANDILYLPAWTSANFFFRRGNDAQFWRAAVQAAAMSYDDPAPLIELADHREHNAVAALDRLGGTARLERGYLHFLIGAGRWEEAQAVAARLASRADSQDRELLMALVDRLIAANQGDGALAAWNRLEAKGRGGMVNGSFQREPSGHGFDWRIAAPPGVLTHWEPARMQFALTASTPDACRLFGQWVMLTPGRYRLRFGYRSEGLAEETGLRWTLLSAASPALVPGDRTAEWNFGVAKAGLHQLQLIYARVPGTTHKEGRVEFTSVGLEML